MNEYFTQIYVLQRQRFWSIAFCIEQSPPIPNWQYDSQGDQLSFISGPPKAPKKRICLIFSPAPYSKTDGVLDDELITIRF